jgi:hypothetical protein
MFYLNTPVQHCQGPVDKINPLILCHQQNQRAILNLLFQATAQTLLQFGRKNLGGTLGATLVLHTWDQQVRPHFHLHCVIAGGVLSAKRDQWLPAHPRFLFPVGALSKVFRGKFLDGLRLLYDTQQLQLPGTVKAVAPLADPTRFDDLLSALRHQPWVVYSKAPFAGPKKLLNYLGHYTHRVAISNARLLSCLDGQVAFHYRDRAAGDVRKTMTLPADEFLRRFLCHVLPSGFQRIRHYGLLASRTKHDDLTCCRQLLGAATPPPPRKQTLAEWVLLLLGIDVDCCPRCGKKCLWRTTLVPPHLARPRADCVVPAPPEDDSS